MRREHLNALIHRELRAESLAATIVAQFLLQLLLHIASCTQRNMTHAAGEQAGTHTLMVIQGLVSAVIVASGSCGALSINHGH